jgi:hypothetical protein
VLTADAKGAIYSSPVGVIVASGSISKERDWQISHRTSYGRAMRLML